MHYSKKIPAFSLVELIVVIGVIWIISLGVSRFDFGRLSQNQELKIETIRIKSIFEEIRNNALLWKAVGTSSVIPSTWKIEVSQTSSGKVRSDYYSGSLWIDYKKSWLARKPFQISSIRCKNLSETASGSLSGTGTFLFTGSLISFTGSACSSSTYKIVELIQSDGRFTETLEINTVTGTIEIQ